MELTWTPSVEAEDGTPVADLSGYLLSWKRSDGVSAFGATSLLSPAKLNYSLELPKGKWLITVSAVSASRGESDPSNELEVVR